MGGDTAEHWQDVYEARRSDEVSWFEPRPERLPAGPSSRFVYALFAREATS